MHIDQRVARVAANQQGLLTTSDARACGLGQREVTHRLRTGRWIGIHRGVYLVGGAPMSPAVTRRAAVLAVGEQASCSHQTAASIWGLRIPVDETCIHVLAPYERVASFNHVKLHRTTAFYDDDLTRVGGLAVTSVERTIVDTAALVGPRRLEQVIDAALRQKLLDLTRLQKCVARLGAGPNRRTAPVHRALADRVPGYKPGDSDLESDVLRLIREWRLPLPVQNYRLVLDGIRFHLDLAWPRERVTVELDSWEYHRGRQAFDDDRRRSNLLVAHRWTGFRFTPSMSHLEIRTTLTKALARGPV